MMIEVKDIIKQGRGKWLVAYTVPFCCGWHRKTILIEQDKKPTIKKALDEINNRDKGF